MKIAAFDSGIGGLSAVAPLLRTFQGIELHYYGDLANLPYGTKSPERIKNLTEKNLNWLLGTDDFDLAIIACNTASAHGLEIGKQLGQKFQLPVLGVIEANCREALQAKPQRLVILATSSTVKSESYLKCLQSLGSSLPIVQQSCPLFVPFVEDGIFEGPALEWVAKRYLDTVIRPGDAVILGCTHYPFLAPFLSTLYPGVLWAEPGASLLQDELLQKKLFQVAGKKNQAKNAEKNLLRLAFSDSTVTQDWVSQLLKRLNIDEIETVFEIVSPVI